MTMAAKRSISRLETSGIPQTSQKLPSELRELIEAERTRLMDAEAVLHCAVIALNAHDGTERNAPDYQGVINTARTLITQSIQRLDAVTLHALLRAAEAPVAVLNPGVSLGDEGAQDAVREDQTKYLN
jgi:hypothetical protein